MKTFTDFDYDLWTTEENGVKKYYSRVKRTGEVTEVSYEVMKVLRSSEKSLKREADKKSENVKLSLNYIHSSPKTNESGWLIDERQNIEDIVIAHLTEEALLSVLTDKQKDTYLNCMKENISLRDFAKSKELGVTTIQDLRDGVRKKYKKYFL